MIPLILTSAGAQPTPPATLRLLIEQAIALTDPDYTANLPGALIEDVLSTNMGPATVMDQARVDAVNSWTTPTMAPYLLAQLGVQLGLPQGLPSNTSVLEVFSGPVGFIVPAGAQVSDGTYQYVLQQGTVIGSSGTSPSALCIAAQSGSWTPAANTVNQVVTQFPTGYTITCNNPSSGTAGATAESVQSYRSRLIGAQSNGGQGFAQNLQTLLTALPNVTPRLVSIQQAGSGWKILCGGGDPYQVAGNIYLGTLDLSTLNGSATTSRNVSVAITEPPNTYQIVYVAPPEQVVTMTVTWTTNLPNYTFGPQVNQLAAPAIQNAVNSIVVGSPINLLSLTAVFQEAVASLLPIVNLSELTFAVYVNGTLVSPPANSQLIAGDSESYFLASNAAITVQQG